jgi:ATP-dependent Lhr-like helicase
MFDFIASYMYEYDAPLAEKRATALTLDRELLRELLGDPQFRDLLDADVIAEVELELQRLAPDRRMQGADALHDGLRQLGPLSEAAVAARVADEAAAIGWLEELQASRRAVPIRVSGEDRWAAVEDLARLRDALGVQPPPGVPAALLEPAADPLGDIVGRYARTHAPFTASQAAAELGLAEAVVGEVLGRLERESRVASGAYQPGGQGTEWVDLEVLRRLRRRSLAALRSEIEAVEPERLGLFLPAWHGIGNTSAGQARLPEVLRALQGSAIPASILERDVLPDRMAYNPADLDLLLAAGELIWIGRGAAGTKDGKVSFFLRDHVPLLLDPLETELPSDEIHRALRAHLARRGASFFQDLYIAAGGGDPATVVTALWDMVWAGEITNDTLAPLRAFVGTKGKARTSRRRMSSSVPPAGSGRWYLVADLGNDDPGPAPEQRGKAIAEQLLERHGVVTRPAVLAEDIRGGFAGLYPVFAAMEDAGTVRRGYFVESLGGAQFGLPGAIDRLRDSQPSGVVVLAAADPANPYGAALAWPEHSDGTPSRRAGAYVVLLDGMLVGFAERGGRALLTFADATDALVAGLIEISQRSRNRSLTLARVDGESALSCSMSGALLSAGFTTGYKGLTYRPGG